MSKGSVNKVILVGNLGADPETRFFPDGGAVCNVSLATTESWKDRQTGQMQNRTEWHKVVLRDRGNYKLGQIAGEYLRKGAKIYVEGRLKTRKWQDQSGQDRYTTEVIADEMQMLDSRSAGQGAGDDRPPMAAVKSPEPQAAQAPAQSPSSAGGFEDFDDDIPF